MIVHAQHLQIKYKVKISINILIRDILEILLLNNYL